MLSFKTLMVLSAPIILVGCAAMNEQECLVTDWRSVGFEDGVSGRPVNSIANYRQACSRHGVTPDLDKYRAGHSEGAEVYCRPGRGFDVGRRGAVYHGVCPADLESEFLVAYADGRHLYELESALRAVNNEIASNKQSLKHLRQDMVAAAAAIIADGTPAEERVRLLAETAELARREGELGEEIVELEREQAIREQELLSYRETLAFGA